MLGIEGAAYATLISHFLQVLIAYIFVRKIHVPVSIYIKPMFIFSGIFIFHFIESILQIYMYVILFKIISFMAIGFLLIVLYRDILNISNFKRLLRKDAIR